MAQKRMFDKTIIDSDAFLELPITSQALYFHLNMRADDDGFIDNWKSISRIVGAKEDDIKILIAKSFVIPFESGVIVIKHWRINNYLQKDRKKTTRHIEELQSLKEINGEYYLLENGEISNILMLDEEREKPEWQIKRDEAYKKSSLPYSFLYKIRNAFNGCECPVCHNTMKTNGIRKYIPTIQHLMPISKGGEHELYNIAIICYSCNSSMKDKIVSDKLNNEEVIEKWNKIINSDAFYTRSTSANIDKNSIVENSIDKNSIDNICSKKSSNEQLKIEILDKTDSLFELFWANYPRKQKKKETYDWFKKNKPNEDFVNYLIECVKKQSMSKQWSKGQFIPLPSTWLNGKRWEDELTYEENISNMNQILKEVYDGSIEFY